MNLTEMLAIQARVTAYTEALQTNDCLYITRIAIERHAYTDLCALIAEVERLQAELKQTQAERDAAIADFAVCTIPCNACKHRGRGCQTEPCLGCTVGSSRVSSSHFEWRGMKGAEHE